MCNSNSAVAKFRNLELNLKMKDVDGKARYWFERAAAKGDEDAKAALAAFDARGIV